MFEVSDDPAERKQQMRQHEFIRSRQGHFMHLYKGNFRSDTNGVIKDTIEALRAELALWEAAYEEPVDTKTNP